MHGFCVHALRATAATNALVHNADIAKVQEWLGHANIHPSPEADRSPLLPLPDQPGLATNSQGFNATQGGHAGHGFVSYEDAVIHRQQ